MNVSSRPSRSALRQVVADPLCIALNYAQRYETVPADAGTAIVTSTPAFGVTATPWLAVPALVA